MTATPDGKVICDKCGGDLGTGSTTECVIVIGMDYTGIQHTLHFGLPVENRCGCVSRVFSKTALAWRNTHDATDPVVGPITWRGQKDPPSMDPPAGQDVIPVDPAATA